MLIVGRQWLIPLAVAGLRSFFGWQLCRERPVGKPNTTALQSQVSSCVVFVWGVQKASFVEGSNVSWLPKPKPRDVQRRRLYHAQQQVAAFLRDALPTVPDIEKFVDDMLACRSLRTCFTSKVLEHVRVVSGWENRTAYASGSVISMPFWARSKFIVIHEVCHVLCGRHYGEDSIADHGAEFATLQLAMVTHFLGEQYGLDLHRAFGRHGIAHSACGDEWSLTG